MMICGKTESGFEFKVSECALDNMELVDLLAEGREDPLTVSKIVKIVLGTDQRKRLYDHVRAADGRVPTELVIEEISEIFKAFGEAGKN